MRLEATLAAWFATLLAAVAAVVLAVVLFFLLLTTVFGVLLQSIAFWSSEEAVALAGVGAIGAVCTWMALVLARGMSPGAKRESRSMGGPVLGAVMAVAATAVALWSPNGFDLGGLWWVPCILAPGLGAFLGTFVALPVDVEGRVTTMAAAALAVGATLYINRPTPPAAVEVNQAIWSVVSPATAPARPRDLASGSAPVRPAPADARVAPVEAPPADEVPVAAVQWQVADAALVGVTGDTTIVRSRAAVRGLDRSSRERWTTAIDLQTSPRIRGAIASEAGTSYVITAQRLTAVSNDGAVLWQRTAYPGEYETVAGASRAGRVYVVVRDADGRTLRQLDAATGLEAWRHRLGPSGPFAVSLAIGDDESLVLATDTAILALTRRGEDRWQRAASGVTVAMGTRGAVHVLHSGGMVEALSQDGRVLWTSGLDGPTTRWPTSTAANGLVYASTAILNTIDLSQPTGRTWRPPGPRVVMTPPVLLASGDVAVGLSDGSVVGVTPAGTLAWRWPGAGQVRMTALTRLVAGPHGLLVEHDGRVTLLETPGPDPGPWPQPGGCWGSTAQACPPGAHVATDRSNHSAKP